jgi:hypothetical protein
LPAADAGIIERLHDAHRLGHAAGFAQNETVPPAIRIVGVADFNRDGYADCVLFNPATRQTALWYLSNYVRIGAASGPTPPSGWSVVVP